MRKFLSQIFSSSNDSEGSKTEYVERKQESQFEGSNEYPYDHYTDTVEDIKQLKREKRHDEAEELLLWCINFAESEDQTDLPRWYYKHLGIVYRKDDRYDDEVSVLERYIEKTTSPRQEMLDRLKRARELADNN